MKKNKQQKKLDKKIKDNIPYLHLYENGLIEISQGVFNKVYKMPIAVDIVDLSLKLVEKVKNTQLHYCNNNKEESFYLTLTVESISMEEALKEFDLITEIIKKEIENTENMGLLLKDVLNLLNDKTGGKTDIKEEDIDNLKVKKNKTTTKDLIKPDKLEIKKNYTIVDDLCISSFYTESYIENNVTLDVINILKRDNIDFCVTYNLVNLKTEDTLNKLEGVVFSMEKEIEVSKKNKVKQDVLLVKKLEKKKELLEKIKSDNTLFISKNAIISIITKNKDEEPEEEEMEEMLKEVIKSLNKYNYSGKLLKNNQKIGFNSYLGIGVNNLNTGRFLIINKKTEEAGQDEYI